MRSILCLTTALAMTISGCSGSDGGDDSGPGIDTQQGALTGRISGEAGHQSVAPGTANMQSSRGEAMVDADMAVVRTPDGEIIGESPIENGSYTVTDLPQTDGPVIVEAQANGTVVGSALVPDGVGGDGLAAMPISAETTAEAEAYAALLADGHAAVDIDAVALMQHVSAEMAVSVSTGAELADGVWDAQVAWADGMAAAGVAGANASASAGAATDAYNRYAAAVHANADLQGAAEAFAHDADAAVAAALGADAEAMVTAEAAASYALATELADGAAADAATALAAAEVAQAEARAQIALADGEIQGQIEAAYAAYDAALAEAANAEAVAAAHVALAQELRGDDGESIFDAVVEAGFMVEGLEGLPGGVPGVDIDMILSEALGSVQTALAEADAALESALAGLDGVEGAGAAFFDYRGQLEAALNQGLGAYLDAESAALALELSAAAEGNADAFLSE